MAVKATEELYFEDFGGTAVAAAFHHADADGDAGYRVVVMAHGFTSSKIGPSRYFVDLARELGLAGISAFRFDQPGSGDSEGRFEDSSFDSWVAAIEHFARGLQSEGYRVALVGSSMGGIAAMAAAAELGSCIRGIALWSPDPLLDRTDPATQSEWTEEGGQRIRRDFWREAASVNFLDAYRRLAVPAYIVFGTADHLIPIESMRRVESVCKPGDRVRVVEGLPHSAWPASWRAEIFRETIEFLSAALA